MADTLAPSLAAPPALLRKLDEVAKRYDELQNSLNDPAFVASPQKMIAASKETGQLEPVVSKYREYQKATKQLEDLREMIKGGDVEMSALAQEELPQAEASASDLLEALKDQFIAAEDNAVDSFFLEIRAGTGGEEAALFGRDLFEMYRKYCEANRWQFIVNDFSTSERGGFKEVIVNVKGDGAYRHLQYEAGGHRVQRVPETEAQGRIHTSAATVAVLPEMPDVEIKIDAKDVEEFGCRGGGPGGQNVNKV
jgi:peptide chain release factor 1